MTPLEYQFYQIKKKFFPRWDVESLWSVSGSLGTKSGHICPDGHCSMTNRTLHVLTGQDEYERILVHLICHAVTKNNHGIHWQERMILASKLAKQIKRKELSMALLSEVEHYRKSIKPNCKSVEKISYDIAVKLPQSTPEVWLEIVSSHYGLIGSELIRKFPAAPKRGFKRARRFLESKNNRQLNFFE